MSDTELKHGDIIEEFYDCIPPHLEGKFLSGNRTTRAELEWKYLCIGMAKEILNLRSTRANAKEELVNSYSKLLDDIWADSNLTAIEIRNMIRKFSKELDI